MGNYTGTNSADLINGSNADDTIDGGLGGDTMIGGLGNDLYYVDNPADVVTEDSLAGSGTADKVISSVNYTLTANVERLTLTGSATTGNGNALNNLLVANDTLGSVLKGSSGNDTVNGDQQNDKLYGGDDDDRLSGGGGNDKLYGGDDSDELEGGSGSDTLNGGSGNDVFKFATGSGTGVKLIQDNAGIDTIDASSDTDGASIDLNMGATSQIRDYDVIIQGPNSSGGSSTPLDFTFLWDLSSSFSGDLATVRQNRTTNDIIAAVNDVSSDAQFGISSFVDRPDAGGSPGDYVYQTNLALTPDETAFSNALDTLTTFNGNDGPEDPLDGLVQLANRPSEVGFRENSSRVALVLTDNAFHQAGDTSFTPNDGDGVVEVEDYASVAQTAAELVSAGITPIFAVTSDFIPTYEQLVADMGIGAVVPLESDSSNLVALLEDILPQVAGGTLIENAIGGPGNDTFIGNIVANSFTGGSGNDTYYVASSDEIVEATSGGTDTAIISTDYTLPANVENLTIDSSIGRTAIGNGAANYIKGDTGDDTLDGLGGSDTLEGGAGSDSYTIGTGDTIIGEAYNGGTDTVSEPFANYTLGAYLENLTLLPGAVNGTGNNSNNNIIGNDASNVLTGGGGYDTFAGGDGNDTYYTATLSITEDFDHGTDTVYLTGGAGGPYDYYTLPANVENLTLQGSADTFARGNESNNIITGNSGINNLWGYGGNDVLSAGSAYYYGSETLVGGTGDDLYLLDNSSSSVTISEYLGSGMDTVRSSRSYTLAADVEILELEGTENIYGTGNTGDNRIEGNSQDNSLSGGTAGADTLIGGAGDDTYTVKTGDTIQESSGAGVDTVLTAINSYTIPTYFENLTLQYPATIGTGNSAANVLTVTGTSRNTSLNGGSGNDTLNSSNGSSTGDDTLNGSTGVDSMTGGNGDDLYYVDNSSDVVVEVSTSVSSTAGMDTVQASTTFSLQGQYIENLTMTGSGAVTGTGNSLDNTIVGNSGGNTLLGLSGDDSITGGTGNDNLQGGAGNDVLNGQGGADTMIGGTENDVYFVNDAGDTFTEFSSEGTDTVNAYISVVLGSQHVENVNLLGATDIDATGNGLENLLEGNSGHNSLSGGTDNDTLEGAAGNDTLSGGDNNDTLDGGDNSDTLDGGLGNDSMVGGLGNDLYFVDSTADIVTETGGQGTDTIQSSATFSVAGTSVENVTLTGSSNIDATGNGLNNLLTGNGGANSLVGGADNDTLQGLGGADTLDGGADVDTMVGGAGNDRYWVDDTGDVITEVSGEGTDIVYPSASYTLTNTLENMTLQGTSAINGTGSSADNQLTGNSGANQLSGSAGFDTLDGNAGNDTLNGGSDDDSLVGGNGNDYLDGISGNDTMVGGSGDDEYHMNSTSDSFVEVSGEGIDTVYSSVDVSLGSQHVDSINLTGGSAIDGTGNGLDNEILGNTSNNVLNGKADDDTLVGGDGADTLIGTDTSAGINEIDVLTGGSVGDRFVLGVQGTGYYDATASGAGLADYAQITDFASNDIIQLAGSSSSYYIGSSPISGVNGSAIYLEAGATDELIGIVQGLSLTTSSLRNTYGDFKG